METSVLWICGVSILQHSLPIEAAFSEQMRIVECPAFAKTSKGTPPQSEGATTRQDFKSWRQHRESLKRSAAVHEVGRWNTVAVALVRRAQCPRARQHSHAYM